MEIEPLTFPGVDPKRPMIIAGPCSAESREQVLKTASELAARGVKADLYCGFRDEPYGMERFLPLCGRVFVATDSGRAGFHGLVTELLRPEEYDMALGCGPEPMMRATAALCREKGIHTETGEFGAEMLVESVNDGPLTLIVDTDQLNA